MADLLKQAKKALEKGQADVAIGYALVALAEEIRDLIIYAKEQDKDLDERYIDKAVDEEPAVKGKAKKEG